MLSQAVTILAVHLSSVRAATVSCNPTSFITSSVSLHSVSFAGFFFAFAAWCFTHPHNHSPKTHMLLRKPKGSFHYIFASLRHAFISVGCSTPAAHNLACLAACPGCGFVMVFVSRWLIQKHTPNPCVSLLLPITPQGRGSLCSTVAGARSQFQSCLPPLALCGTHPSYSVDKCATQLYFFLAAGAITSKFHAPSNTSLN